MSRSIDPTKRIQGNPCCVCGGSERYACDRKCVNCAAMRQRDYKAGKKNPQHRIAAKPPKPMPHPHVIESDWIETPTLARLMAGR